MKLNRIEHQARADRQSVDGYNCKAMEEPPQASRLTWEESHSQQ